MLLQEFVFLHQTAADDFVVPVQFESQCLVVEDLLFDELLDQVIQLFRGGRSAVLQPIVVGYSLYLIAGDIDACKVRTSFQIFARRKQQRAESNELEERL